MSSEDKAEEQPARPLSWPRRIFAEPGRTPALIVLALLVIMRALDPAVVQSLRLRGFDFLEELVPREYQPLPIEIVAIDDKSLAQYGQWPWSRARVAQLADAIAIILPRTVELSPRPSNGRSTQLRELEIINVIKKPGEYAPQLTNVHVDKPEMMTAADTGSPLRAGQEYVFLLQVHSTPDIGWIALYPCGAPSLNDASLAMAREAASNGAD